MKSKTGFTIVELLIVIVVIAILAAISVVAYNGIQTRAKATILANDIKAMEKAFNLYKTSSGASTWWRETDPELLQGGSARIGSIITNNAGFREYLQSAPSTQGLGSYWSYDNDGDYYNGCGGSSTGVNLYMPGYTLGSPVAQALDERIDDGDLACGNLREYSSGWLVYSLALNETN